MSELESKIYSAILGEKKVKIIKILCENSDKNGFINLKISEICNLANSSKPTAIDTINLLESKKIFERVKNGVYRFKNLEQI